MSRLASWLAAAALLAATHAPSLEAFVLREETGQFMRWPASPAAPQVPYVVDLKGTPDVPGLDEVEAVKAGFRVWTDVTSAFLAFRFDGTRDLDRLPDEELDRLNFIGWIEEDWSKPPPDGFGFDRNAVAMTLILTERIKTGRGDAWKIVQTILLFNGEHFTFAIDGRSQAMDVQNIAAHEAGHWLFLDHPPIPEATMFATTVTGETKKRDLHVDDKNGISRLYPQDDRFEENDALADSRALSPSDATYEELNALDDDWYAISLRQGESVTVRIDFTDRYGDLQLALHDSQGTRLQTSFSQSRDRPIYLTQVASTYSGRFDGIPRVHGQK